MQEIVARHLQMLLEKNDINMSVYKVDIQNNYPLKMKESKNFQKGKRCWYCKHRYILGETHKDILLQVNDAV